MINLFNSSFENTGCKSKVLESILLRIFEEIKTGDIYKRQEPYGPLFSSKLSIIELMVVVFSDPACYSGRVLLYWVVIWKKYNGMDVGSLFYFLDCISSGGEEVYPSKWWVNLQPSAKVRSELTQLSGFPQCWKTFGITRTSSFHLISAKLRAHLVGLELAW